MVDTNTKVGPVLVSVTCPKCSSVMTGRLRNGKPYCRCCGYIEHTGDRGTKPKPRGVRLLPDSGEAGRVTNTDAAPQYFNHTRDRHDSTPVPITFDRRMLAYDTDLAFCVRIVHQMYWFPRSLCTLQDDSVVMVPEWLAVEKGLV